MGNGSRGFTDDVDRDLLKSHGVLALVISILLVVIEVSGIVCNSVILMIYYKYTRLRTATNLFILNLASCNFLLAILDIVFSAPSSLERAWHFGDPGCTVYGFGYLYLMAVSVCTLAIISFDRFCVITKPVRNMRPLVLTKKHSRGLIVFIHIYSLIFTLPPLLGWNRLVADTAFQTGCYIDYDDNEAPSLAYTIVFTVFTCVLPFILTTCCYSKIYHSVKNSSKRSTINSNYRNKQKSMTRGDSAANLSKIRKRSLTHTRTARMIAVVMFFFLLTWLPVKVTAFCRAFGVQVPDLVLYVSVFLAKSCVMYNAVVYVFLNHRFRAAFLHLTFFCRDDDPLALATSARLGDVGVSVSEHCGNKSRASKKFSQLSIVGSSGSLKNNSSASVDVAKAFCDRYDAEGVKLTNGHCPKEGSVIGYWPERGQVIGVPSCTRIVSSYGYVNGVLEEEKSEESSGKVSSSEEQSGAVSTAQDNTTSDDNAAPEYYGMTLSNHGVNSGSFGQAENMVLDDESK